MGDPPTADGPPVVRRLGADDWREYREVRLAMLHDSPWAFTTTLADATGHDEVVWRQRLTDNRVFVASIDGELVGSVSFSDTFVEDPRDASLIGMWVDPRFRGTGAAAALVQAVLDEARSRRKRRVLLDVVEDNVPARLLYERCGFVPTGVTSPYPHDRNVQEIQMERVL